jgi:hypothetical protein
MVSMCSRLEKKCFITSMDCEHRLYCCLRISHFGGRVFDLFPDDGRDCVTILPGGYMKMNACVQAPAGDSRRPHLEPAC